MYRFFHLCLKDPAKADFQVLRQRLASHSAREERYRQALKRLLDWSDRLFEGKPVAYSGVDPDNLTPLQRLCEALFVRRFVDVIQNQPVSPPNPWSGAAYDRCLLIAVVYPIGAAAAGWIAFGSGGAMANLIGLADSGNGWFRIFQILYLCIVVALIFYSMRRNTKGYLRLLSYITSFFLILGFATISSYLFSEERVVFAVAFAGAGAAAFTGAGTIALIGAIVVATAIAVAYVVFGFSVFTGVVAFAIAFSIAFSVVFAVEFAFAFAFAFVLTIVFALAFLAIVARQLDRFGVFLAGLTAFYFITLLVVAHAAGYGGDGTRRFSLLIGIGLLPLVNAPFDWLSTGLTRFLLRKNWIEDRAIMRVFWSLTDFICALLLLVALCVATVLSLHLLNGSARLAGFLGPVIDVDAVLLDVANNPWETRHYWIYFAVLSTMMPTLLHLVIWLLSTGTIQWNWVRNFALRHIDNNFADGEGTRFAVISALTAQVTAAFLLALCVAAAVWWTLNFLLGFTEHLIALLSWVSRLSQALLL